MDERYPYQCVSEKMDQLFIPAHADYEEIMEDFRRNGHDSEYCPDSDSEQSAGCFRGPGSRTRPRNGVHGPGVRRGGGGAPAPSPGFLMRAPPQNVGSAAAYAAFALGLIPPSLGINMCCAFCRKNGETLAFYSGHMLKDSKGRVTCPILRAYTCPYCGANGDKAHTVKYCPVNLASETAMGSLARENLTHGGMSPPSPRRACSISAQSDIAGRRRRYRRSH